MKKNTRRLLAICLAVMLILSVAVVASAATRSFTYDGGSYTGTLTKGSQSDVSKVIPGATGYEHTYGNVTPIYDNISFSITRKVTLPVPFDEAMTTLLNDVGLKATYTAADSVGDVFYYAEVYDASGTYKLGIVFECYNAPWSVMLEMPSATGTTYPDSSGTISQAPTGQWEIVPMKVS